MDIAFVKFLMLWTMCEVIGLTMCMSLKDSVYASNSRLKRSTTDNFSLFGFGLKPPFSVSNPLTKVKESFNSFGGIFTPATYVSQDRDIYNNFKPVQDQSIINNLKSSNNEPINTGSPIEDSYQSMLKKTDKKTVQQVNKSKDDIKPAPENKLFNDKSETKTKLGVSERKKEYSENKNVTEQLMQDIIYGTNNESTKEELPNEDLEKEIDKKLIDYIFQITPDGNIEAISTTTDVNIDYTTETDDYESTTTDDLLRIPANVVASLLG